MALTPQAVALAVLAVKFLLRLVVLQRAVRMAVAVVGQAQAVLEAEITTTAMALVAQFASSGPVTHVVFHQQIQETYK